MLKEIQKITTSFWFYDSYDENIVSLEDTDYFAFLNIFNDIHNTPIKILSKRKPNYNIGNYFATL